MKMLSVSGGSCSRFIFVPIVFLEFLSPIIALSLSRCGSGSGNLFSLPGNDTEHEYVEKIPPGDHDEHSQYLAQPQPDRPRAHVAPHGKSKVESQKNNGDGVNSYIAWERRLNNEGDHSDTSSDSEVETGDAEPSDDTTPMPPVAPAAPEVGDGSQKLHRAAPLAGPAASASAAVDTSPSGGHGPAPASPAVEGLVNE
ncbi:unnamed protein product, partial [Amoebophrya sp. A25]|eukprot:GSA25T00018650001.1